MTKLSIGAIALALALAACDSYSSGYATADPPPPTGSGFTLTFNNVLDWCDVTVDGTVFAHTSPPPKKYPPGTVVHVAAAPTSETFIWGYWTGTDAATSSTAKDTSTTAAITMSGDKTVKVCCPFADGTGC